MKKILILALIPLTALMLVASGVIYAVDNIDKIIEVKFADPNLEALVRYHIEKPSGTIHRDDIKNVQSLDTLYFLTHPENDIEYEPITNLSGLEHFSELNTLVIHDSEVADLLPLPGLTNLNCLILSSDKTLDLAPLSNLSNLEHLSLSGCQLKDLSVLSTLPNLNHLGLSDSNISNLSPISNVTNLSELYLSGNDISDLSPLSSLTGLKRLDLANNQINDLTPLSTLANLTNLSLSENNISDLSPLLENNCLQGTKVIEDDGSYYYQTTVRLGVVNNPLSEASINEYIPQLRDRGIIIFN